MRDRTYYISQAAHCRRLSKEAGDSLTARRLDLMAREYDAMANDLARSEEAQGHLSGADHDKLVA